MPSPIARSSSVPDFRAGKPSFRSNRSTCSSQSYTHGRRKPSVLLSKHRRSSKSCDLTEESLSEHNRRQAAAGKKNTECSPYYKGLLDSQRYIDRMRSVRTSPGRESIITQSSNLTSISTIIYKIQGWGSACFRGKGRKNASAAAAADAADYAPPPAQPPPLQPVLRVPSPSRDVEPGNSLSSVQSEIPDSLVLKEFERRNEVRLVDQKPLRERVRTAPPKGGSVQQTQKEPTEEKFGWAKKYRPKFLKDFICNRDKVQVLQDLVSRGECNHIIFEGPPGVGKKTMVWALLREAFGPEKLETREEPKEFKLKGEGVESIEVNVRISSKHIEIDLSELHGHEKSVIVAVIEESKTTNAECDHALCRVVVLYQADRLSTDAQHYIRWIMERYKGCIRVMFCCSDVSRLQPMRDICKHIPLSPPSKDEIIKVLEYIAGQEGINLPHTLAERIAEKSKQNLRQAIRSFEASWQSNYPFKEDQVILTGWEVDIANIAKNILDEQSPKQLYVIRGKLQKLIEHDVSPDFIFDTLVEELGKHLEDHLKPKLDSLYLEYKENGLLLDVEMTIIFRSRQEELDMRNNDPVRNNFRGFMKIEEFTAKFMSFYKSVPKKDDPTAMKVREELLGKTMLDT